jgi:hypothetical protein
LHQDRAGFTARPFFQSGPFRATFDNRAALAQTLRMTDKPPPRKPDPPKADRRENRALLLPIGGGRKPWRQGKT